jgi:hypothetical protein
MAVLPTMTYHLVCIRIDYKFQFIFLIHTNFSSKSFNRQYEIGVFLLSQ